jgi:hypothetical protein
MYGNVTVKPLTMYNLIYTDLNKRGTQGKML